MKKNHKNTFAQNLKPLIIIGSLILFLVCSFGNAQLNFQKADIATTVYQNFDKLNVKITKPVLVERTGLGITTISASFYPTDSVDLEAQTDRDMKDGTLIEWKAHSDTKASRTIASSTLYVNSSVNAYTTPFMTFNLANSGFYHETVYLTVVITEPGNMFSIMAMREIEVGAVVN